MSRETWSTSRLWTGPPRLSIESLSLAIDSILACVYTPSLQELSNVLSFITLEEIELWVYFNNIRIPAVVEIVLKGLENDTHTIYVIRRLAESLALRDAMLEHKPQLLSGIIKACLVNERSFQKYSAVPAILLGHVLPPTYLIPANLSNFLSALTQAISGEDRAYLDLLEIMLRSNASTCFRVLSQAQQYTLTSTLAALLSSTDNTVVILALSCLASLSSCPGSADTFERDLNNTKSLFTAEKGRKVVRLVLGTASVLLSGDESEDASETEKTASQICNILEAIEHTTLSEWLSTKEGGAIVRRLLDKLDLTMSFLTINLVCRFIPVLSCSATSGMIAVVADRICVRSMDHLREDNSCSNSMQALTYMLPLSSSKTSCISTILAKCFDVTMSKTLPPIDWRFRAQLRALTMILDAVRSMANMGSEFSVALLEHADLLQRFSKHQDQCHTEHELSNNMRQLTQYLCRIILEAQFAPQESKTRMLTAQQNRIMIDKLILLSAIPPKQQFCTVPKSASVFLQEANSTPSSGADSHAWRNRLMDELQRDAHQQHFSIVARMDSVCRDLERRAEINEEPLRECQAELAIAQESVRQLQSTVAEMTSDLQQRDVENQGVYDERQRLENVISELIHENEVDNNLVRNLQHVEAELNQKIRDLNKEAHAAQTSLQEQVKVTQQRCNTAESELLLVRESLATEEAENDRLSTELHEKHGIIETHLLEISDLAQLKAVQITKLDEQACENLEQEALLLKQTQQIRELERQLESVRADHLNALSEAQDSIEGLRERLNRQNAEETQLRTQLERTEVLAEEKMNLLIENHSVLLRTLEDDLALTKKRAATAYDTLQQENTTLRSALTKVKSSYGRRCDEFQKAQDLSRRLMAVMGGASTQLSSPSIQSERRDSSVHRNKSSTTTSKRARGQPQSPMRTESPFDHDMTVDMSYDTAEKENETPAKGKRDRRSLRKEDSAILSELSGLGIQ